MQISLSHRRAMLFIAVFSIAIYANTLQNGFSYDDYVVITINQKNLNDITKIVDIFSRDYFLISAEVTYRPLVTISYFLDQYIWRSDPFGFHLTNLLLHLANIILVYSLFNRICQNDLQSIASTVLYSAHPALTEAINSVGFREDLLAAAFVLLSISAYVRGNHVLSIASYWLALMSKESAFPFPLILIAYDYLYRQRITPKKYLWYFIIAGVYLYLRFLVLYNPIEQVLSNKISLLGRLASIPVALFYYIKVLLLPLSLTADYANFDFLFKPMPIVYLITFAVLIIFLRLIKMGSLDRTALFGITWFMLTLTPVLGIIPIIDSFAERFLYLPTIGFVLFIGSFCIRGRLRWAKILLLIAVMIFFPVLSHNRNTVWKSDIALWFDTISKSPRSYRTSINLSSLFTATKQYDAAIAVLKRYLELAPEHPAVYNNLGNAYTGKGDYRIAIKNYEKAILLDLHYTEPRMKLAAIYKMEGKFEKALEECRKAIEIEPDNPDLYQSMGIIYAEQGLFDKAVKAFETALMKDPLSTEAHYGLGILYEGKGMDMKAFQEYQEELAINPLYSEARIAIGNLYAKNGWPREAKREFLAVLREEPDNEEARLSLHKLREMKLNLNPAVAANERK